MDVLVASGDRPAARRALKAAGGDAAVRAHGLWLPEETLRAMVQAAEGDPRLPQRVGRALVCSPQASFFLRYSGLATPERAYRSSDRILAREARGALYEPAEVESGRARLMFHPVGESRPDALFCSLRAGMLEALPLAYGLLPARVREIQCASRGAACCSYDVRWSRSVRHGLVAGALGGVMLGVSLGVLAELAPWGIAIAAAALGLLAAAAGRSFDLARQLDAVAGARRGQLAVLDQADRSLAEKMDQFARFEAAERDGGEDGAPRHAGLQPVDAESADREFQSVDLVALVQRALDSQQSHLASLPPVQLELPEDPLWLEAEPIQLEMVVVQLVRNAAAAVADEAEGGGEGTIRVSLRTAGESLELCIEDDGPGIEEETVDEVFDPVVAAGRSPRSRGLGLSVVHRVVKDHGGELRLESAPGRGTRVTVLLPGQGGESA